MRSLKYAMVVLGILGTLMLTDSSHGADWIQEGSGPLNLNAQYRADWPSMAMAADGTVYVTWSEYYYSPVLVFVKHWNGSNWVQDGSGSLNINPSADGHYPKITIANGVPYVAWRESDSLYVKHWNGSNWVQDGGRLNIYLNKSVEALDLTEYNGTPYVAWSEYDGTANQIFVKHWDGGSWVQDGTGSLNIDAGQMAYYPSIAVFNQVPYVAWNEGGGLPQIYVKHWNGSSWVQDGSGSLNINAGHMAGEPSLVISGNTPYVAWAEGDGDSMQIHVKHWNGSAWVQNEDAGLNLDASHAAFDPKLAPADNGPYVVWSEIASTGQNIYVKHWNGSVWVQDGIGSLNVAGMTASHPDILVCPGIPWVVWSETDAYQDHSRIYVKSYKTASATATPTPSLLTSRSVKTFPNPAQNEMTFTVTLERPANVTIDVFNLSGEPIAHQAAHVSGRGNIIWDCRGVAPGVYLCRIMADGQELSKMKVAVTR